MHQPDNARPVYEMLKAAADRRSGHMPGHKGRAPFGEPSFYALDTTELPVTDDLYSPERGLLQAQRLYARAAGAGATLFLHNGSTCGIHAMLQLWAKEGDTVLLPRNAHLSAVNACILGGLHIVWMPVCQRPDGYCSLKEETVLRTLREHPEAKTVLITRPDYFGCCLRLEKIAAEAHRLGVRLAVDEAHGAHLPWMDGLPSAGAAGADAWVQSVHKTLPGLTGTAVLHLRDAADEEAARRVIRREQTSSPSFILMQSIDDSRAWMEAYGKERLAWLTGAAERLRSALPELGYRDAYALWQDTGLMFDPTRIVIDAPQGGHALADVLQAMGIDAEMADHRRVVLILTAMTDEEDIKAIHTALAAIRPEAVSLPSLPDITCLPEAAMDVRPAAMGEMERVPLERAAGRVAAQSAGLYPPGIPLFVPGEIIPDSMIEMLKEAGAQQRFGVEGDAIWCARL